ncbi:MAG: FAD-binding protein, partial [Muribaculaceae bacterium]|nr:FAD-binding protein [Muribaculaceae bacterium]
MYRITHDADLTGLTTFGIHAGCGCLVEYEGLADLMALADGMPELFAGEVFNLGGGSNVLFADGVYLGTVLRCVGNGISQVSSTDARGQMSDEAYPRLRVQAGVGLDTLVSHTAALGLWGLENLAAIPGCVGGAAVQNVGAYGAEFSQCVTVVRAFDLDAMRPVEYSAVECDYGYRHSFFKTPDAPRLAIYEVEVRLSAMRAPRLGYAGIREALGGISDEAVTPSEIVAAV